MYRNFRNECVLRVLLSAACILILITIFKKSCNQSSKEKTILETVFESRNILMDTFCTGKSCFYVYDRLCQFENGSFFVVRLTTPEKSLKKGFTGIAILKTPIPLNENNKNTRNWEINRDLISNGTVVGFQLEKSISSGLFPLPNENSKILIIGVATGILQTFLAQQFPKMFIEGIDIDPNSIELSKKWYGFEENERNQIIIDNAQNYLEGISSKNEEKYKAIMIDVCYNNLEFEDEWMCPVKEFRQISTIENMNKTLEYNGILTMNIMHKSKDINLHQELLELYKTVFNHCELASDNNYRMKNQILTCFNSKQGFHSPSNYNKILSKYSDYVSWI